MFSLRSLMFVAVALLWMTPEQPCMKRAGSFMTSAARVVWVVSFDGLAAQGPSEGEKAAAEDDGDGHSASVRNNGPRVELAVLIVCGVIIVFVIVAFIFGRRW